MKLETTQEITLIGLKCPMNFVKTKLALEQMKPGEILKVCLDKGEPLKNVSRSVKNEGHEIAQAEYAGEQIRKEAADYGELAY